MKKNKQNQEKISKIKPFVNKYDWKGINCPSKIDNGKTFEKNNPTIALSILSTQKREIFPAYISKINSNYEKQIILLMIPTKGKEGRHYLQ